MILFTLYCCLFSYLLGSIPTGKLIGLYYGVDIQKKGSGNIGFANAVRVLGWKPAAIVLFFDAFKGFLPLYISGKYLPSELLPLVGLAAIIGHVFPIWLKLRGGKGIATGLGVTLTLNYRLAFLGLLVYILVFLITKRSAISSILSSWSLPVFFLFLMPAYAWFYFGLGVFATFTHRSNIKKLVQDKMMTKS